MKIIIAGSGEVGFHLAKLLSFESQDIILIDVNRESLIYASTHLDIRVVRGNATSISVLKDALNGDLSKVNQCVKLGIFVSCTNDFHQQPEVANGASDLMVEIFGDKGKHARFAVGTNSLPKNVPVEVDAVFEIK